MTKPKPHLQLEQSFQGVVAGFDEAGCGPWAGPVVAAAAIIKPDQIPSDVLQMIHDSKQLTPSKREHLYSCFLEIGEQGILYGIGQASVLEIDTMNIANATKLAMHRAFEALPLKPDVALVDGNRRPNLPCEICMVIKGDQTSISIAAASIFAKVTRDRIMADLDQEYPLYGWKKNAGYGTAVHQQALAQHGVTPHHRRTYAPIARFLSAQKNF